MTSLGFGIVGCGMIARFHAKALAEIAGARTVAALGRDAAATARFAAEHCHGAASFTAIDDFLNHPGLDVVVVCTPSGAHLEPAVAAAKAGKHVVVEKPLEITPERCDAIIRACDDAGVKLCTIFPSRFADANRELKAAVDAGRFGRITLGETTCKWWRTQQYYDNGGWRGTWALDGGGATMNQAVHNVDLLLWLLGPADSVTGFTATLAHERIEVEDTAVAAVRFRSGALGVILAATSVHPGFPKTIAVHGDRGSAVVEQEDVIAWQFAEATPGDDAVRERFAKKVGASGGASDPAAISHEYHARQLRDFVDAVRQDRTPAVDGREGRKSVELICALYEASRTGRAVTLTGQ
jgi:predicted dehydrogenase